MLRFKADYDFLQVIRTSSIDSYDGEMGVEITLNPGPWKEEVDKKLADITNQLTVLLEKDLTELELRQHNPSLQDAWDQYQTIKRLVQNEQERNSA